MELLIKASSIMVLAVVTRLLLSKHTPELAMVLSLAAVTAVLLMAARYAAAFRSFFGTVDSILGGQTALTGPLLRCVGIGIISRISSDFCKDASQGAAASALELMGTVCALGVAAPLLLSVLKTIGGLL